MKVRLISNCGVLVLALFAIIMPTRATASYPRSLLLNGESAVDILETAPINLHQYRWSDWLSLNDGKLNGVNFSFRKGDNDFMERGTIFIRLYNRYQRRVSGDVDFVIVDQTGARSGTHSFPFYIKAGSLDEDEGAWSSTPGNNDSPDAWARASFRLQEIRIRNFRIVEDD